MRIAAGLALLLIAVLVATPAAGAAQAPAEAAAPMAPAASQPPASSRSPSSVEPSSHVQETAGPPIPDSPLRLLAALEAAWLASDSERLASLVDTTSVRIGLKPGVPPAAAVTRNAAAFLFQDQLRLVKTREFRVVKLEVPKKGPARAVASWDADWGGRQGVRTLEVKLTAVGAGGRWMLTEVRADD